MRKDYSEYLRGIKVKTRLTITIEEKLLEKLKKKAKLVNRNLSNYVEWLLKRTVKDNPEKKT